MSHKKKAHIKKSSLGIPKEMHEAHKHDSGYQSRVKKLESHAKKGGVHPMEKEYSKMMKMQKKARRGK